MRSFLFSLCCCLFMLCSPLISLGAVKTVTITWTIPNINDVTGYKMYYAYSGDMANKKLACQTSNPTAATLTCEDINFEHSPVYFTIAAIISGKEATSPTKSETFVTSISMVQGFKMEAQDPATPPPTSKPLFAINFQPGEAPTPTGFTNDHGLTFDSQRGYGWSAYMPNSRDRNDPASPDQSYDTNIIYIDSSSTWEFNLPNGDYTVTVCAGDPSYPAGLQSVQVEGTRILNDTISPDTQWQEQTLTTTVSDGRLTLTFIGSNDTKICWIKIYSTQL